MLSSRADVFAVTETWFSERDAAHRTEATPPGFKLVDHIRNGRMGGGTALLVRDSLSAKKTDTGEKLLLNILNGLWIAALTNSKIMIIYRIPYSSKHLITTRTFFEDLQATWNQ